MSLSFLLAFACTEKSFPVLSLSLFLSLSVCLSLSVSVSPLSWTVPMWPLFALGFLYWYRLVTPLECKASTCFLFGAGTVHSFFARGSRWRAFMLGLLLLRHYNARPWIWTPLLWWETGLLLLLIGFSLFTAGPLFVMWAAEILQKGSLNNKNTFLCAGKGQQERKAHDPRRGRTFNLQVKVHLLYRLS